MKRLIIHHYILAAVGTAALLFASSCMRESDVPGEEILQERVWDVVLNATIADNDPATRSVTVSPEAITCTWSSSDKVALVYNGEVISQLTVSSISGNTAQLTGKVRGAYPSGTQMSLYYGGTNYDYSGQNGTKASAESRAYLKADITTVTQANKILTLSAAELKHQQAYFELSFRNGPDQLKISSVEVTGTDHIIKTRTIGPNGGAAYFSNTSEGEHFTITADGSEGLSTVYFVISDDGEYPTAPTYTFKVTAVGISEPFTKEYKLDDDNNVINPDLAKSLKIENGSYHSGEWILHQQTLSYTAPVSQSVVYDGQSHELVTAGTVTYDNQPAEGAVMEYYVHAEALGAVVDTATFSPFTLSTVTWSTEVPASIEPGDYYVWYRIKGGVNFEDVSPLPATGMPAVIDKRTLDVVFPVGVANLTYTGSAQALVVPGSLKDHLSEEFNPGLEIQYFSAYVTPDGTTDPDWPEAMADGWSTEIPYGLHAGKYYVWYKVDGGAHYKDVAPYRVVLPSPSTLAYIPIAQTDAVIANAVPIEGLVYNGAEQQLVLPADASDGCEVTYFVTESATTVPAADATGWTTEIAKAKNAGTYYIWTKVEDKSGNQNVDYSGITGVSAAAVVTTIAKAPITVTVPAKAANWTYDGTEHTLLADSPVTAVTYKDKDNQNASAIANTESPNAAELYYIVNGVATKYTPETPNLPKAENAGNYAISYRVDGGRNFESKSATSLGTVTVSTATPTVTPPVAATGLVYSGSDQDLLASAGSTDLGTLQYAVSTTNSAPTTGWSTDHPTGKAATTYYVFYRVVGDSSLDEVSPAAVTNSPVTIAKATLMAIADDKSKYYGEDNPELTVTVTGFKNGETASTAAGYVAPTASTTVTATTSVGGYTISVSGGSADNYTFAYAGGILEIKEAEPTLLTVPTINPDNLVYTGNTYSDDKLLLASEGTASGASAIRYGKFRSDVETDSPSVPTQWHSPYSDFFGREAGYYYIYVQVEGDANHSNKVFGPYGPKQIAKANQSAPTLPSAMTLTSGAISDAGITTAMEYSTDSGSTWTTVQTEGTITDLSSGTLLIRYKADANHNAGEAAEIEVS